MRAAGAAAAIAWLTAAGTTGAAQLGRPVLVVQPIAAEIPIGLTQPFQLLDMNGRAVPSDEWSLSDPTVADLTVEDGRARLTGRRDGVVTLVNGRGARSDAIRVRPRAPEFTTARWLLRPVDGRFTKVLGAAATYFYEDRGRASAHIRAIRKDGLQAWQWPPPLAGGQPTLLATDAAGGVLLRVATREHRELVSLDDEGRERWRMSAPGVPPAGIAHTSRGAALYVSDAGPPQRLIALDGPAGRQTAALLLDGGQTVHRGFRVHAGGFVCDPSYVKRDALPLHATPVVANARGGANVAYAEWSIVADAGACAAGARVAPSDIRVHTQQQLVLLDVDPGFAVTRHILDASTNDANGGERSVVMQAPMPALLAGSAGHLLAVRRLSRDWVSGEARPLGEFVLRLSGDARHIVYRVPLPAAREAAPVSLLSSDGHRAVYAARGQTVLSFDADSGRERWRWMSPRGPVDAVLALEDDALIVRNGAVYTTLDGGQVRSDVDEAHMLFVLRHLPEVMPSAGR